MKPGTLFYDPATDKVGEYQDRAGAYAMLRPVGGGIEWQADPDSLRTPTEGERLSANVRARNERTWKEPKLEPSYTPLPPPVPDPDCTQCVELALLRKKAREERDYSAETDANVLLRRHLKQTHAE